MINLNSKKYVSKNVLSEKELIQKIKKLKKQGEKIGLCTGSFDLLHPGHITHLISAKKMCDVLLVAIARDHFSSAKYPGENKPIFSHDLRAFMVSKLKPVDFVFLDDGLPDTVTLIKPDVYIKGPDYADEKYPTILLQKKMLASFGGKIAYTKDEKLSTKDIIDYIKNIKQQKI